MRSDEDELAVSELRAGATVRLGELRLEIVRELELGGGGEGMMRAWEGREQPELGRRLIWWGPRHWAEQVERTLGAWPGSPRTRPASLPQLMWSQPDQGLVVVGEPMSRARSFVDRRWRELSRLEAIEALEGLARALQAIHQQGMVLHGLTRQELMLDPGRGELFVAAMPRLRPKQGSEEEIWRDLRLFGELLFENFLDRDHPGGHALAAMLQDREELQRAQVEVAGLPQVLAGCVTPYGELAYLGVDDLLEGLKHLRSELERPLQLRVGAASTVGTYIFRRNNQDACGWTTVQTICGSRPQTHGFFCVADGIGGIEDGERASGLAVREGCAAFGRAWQYYGPQALQEESVSFARAIVKVVGQRLALQGEFDPAANRGGTTFTGVMICEGRASVGHVGDSRAHLWRGGELLALTEDHNLVNILIRLGELDPAEDHEDHPSARTIARFLSTAGELEAHRISGFGPQAHLALGLERQVLDQRGFELRPGDVLLLTSDGAHGELREARLVELLRERGHDPQGLVEAIVALTRQQVGRDNATALAVLVEGP